MAKGHSHQLVNFFEIFFKVLKNYDNKEDFLYKELISYVLSYSSIDL